MTRRRRFVLGAVGAALAATLAGCDRGGPPRPSFKATDVTGADFGRDFSLTGHDGKRYALADFRGKLVVVFFGFTQCPDVCPTTMAQMATVMDKLGPAAADVQVVFVTVDPERDNAQLLAQYVPAFDPRFLGLYGTADETAKVAREFKVFYQKVPGKTPGTYSVDHTAGVYVFDRQGKLRLFAKHDGDADAMTADLRTLLAQPA